MDGPAFYRLEALDFNHIVIGELEVSLRAMPKDLLIVRVPDRSDFESVRELRKDLMGRTGLEVLLASERVVFLRIEEIVDPRLLTVELGRSVGWSIRLVGD